MLQKYVTNFITTLLISKTNEHSQGFSSTVIFNSQAPVYWAVATPTASDFSDKHKEWAHQLMILAGRFDTAVLEPIDCPGLPDKHEKQHETGDSMDFLKESWKESGYLVIYLLPLT